MEAARLRLLAEPVHATPDPAWRVDLERALATLPPQQAELCRLYAAGYTHQEIGARMGWPPKTVGIRLQRVFQRLRNSLEG